MPRKAISVIGFEDRPIAGSDRDYNDLLFAFPPTRVATAVPVPGSLALMGLGSLMLGAGMRCKRG